MSLSIQTYARKPFLVQAIKVTTANMDQIAQWCGGAVLTEKQGRREVKYIKVDVTRPMTEKQSKAYAGDLVLKASSGYKVYTAAAFEACFDEVELGTLPDNQPPLFEAAKCGKTQFTLDHKPCVLDADHGKRPCSSIILAPMPTGYPEPSTR